MTDITINGNKLYHGKKEIFSREFQIKQVLEIAGYCVILTDVPKGRIDNENVFCINLKGDLIWRISHTEHLYQDSPYMNMEKDIDDTILLMNWDGGNVKVNVLTGEIISKGWSK